MNVIDMADYMAKRRARRRAELVAMSGSKCARCEDTTNLQFNHLDRFSKAFELSGAALDKAWWKIVDEWRKCELVCREHHLDYTRWQWETKELESWSSGLRGEYLHGTPRMYHDKKCRCESCKLAKRQYRNGLIANSEHFIIED